MRRPRPVFPLLDEVEVALVVVISHTKSTSLALIGLLRALLVRRQARGSKIMYSVLMAALV